MSSQKVLLLNASNMSEFPVYPYAFIQVPAVARQSGIDVICKDLLGIAPEVWKQVLQSLIEKNDPAMILITLRNTDSLDAQDYEPGVKETYFPIERTKVLIETIRDISDLKIALGGFSFSLLSNELMHYLHPDFGVIGGPDGFFAQFENLQNGNLGEIPNLTYFYNDRILSNPQIFYPPFSGMEYTHQTVEEMMSFYRSIPSSNFIGAPIEIIRGCSHACVFCAEPHVVGRRVRYRDISAVMGDIEFLVDHGIIQFHMISSELNPEGNSYVLELAEKIRSFNEHQIEDCKVKWNGANYLLNFNLDEYRKLHQSGFTGGWFDITALDDENAHAMRTPYRNNSLLPHLKAYAQAERAYLEQQVTQSDFQAEIPECKDEKSKNGKEVRWSIFLGNPATTIKTIRNTLQVANREGLSKLFGSCYLNANIRVFDYEELDEFTLASTYSISPDMKRIHYRQLLPSFTYPPKLLQYFSETEISEIFSHFAETYLSKKYLQTRDWSDFVRKNTSAASISHWMLGLSNTKGVDLSAWPGHQNSGSEGFKELFKDGGSVCDSNEIALKTMAMLVSASLQAYPEFFESLHLPTAMDKLGLLTPYEIALVVFTNWEFVEGMPIQIRSVSPKWKRDLLQFCVQAILYQFNVVTNPKYREFFMVKVID